MFIRLFEIDFIPLMWSCFFLIRFFRVVLVFVGCTFRFNRLRAFLCLFRLLSVVSYCSMFVGFLHV